MRLLHPYGLHDLEDGRPDDHEDEEGDELRRDGVAVALLGRLADVASLGNVLGVELVGLAHVGRRRHLGGEGGGCWGGWRWRGRRQMSRRDEAP